MKSNNSKPTFPFSIEKDLINKKVVVIDNIGTQKFGYLEKQKTSEWQLFSDTMTINGFLCNRAVMKYDTTKIDVWYCNNLPYLTGPFEYTGLPGLILKSEDTNGWSAEIISISQNIKEEHFFNIPKYILVAEDEYKKAKKAMREKFKTNQEISIDDGTIKIKKRN